MDETLDLSHANWFTSSYSNGQGGNCVEAATNLPGLVAVRDSKDPGGPTLAVRTADWQSLLAAL